MSNKSRGAGFWVSAWLPVALGIALVTMESTPAFGGDRTNHPFRWLVQFIFGPLSDRTWGIVHMFMRKSGHFIGYGALGLAWLRAWKMNLPDSIFLVDFLLGLAGTVLVASFDEWHQTFLPNRVGSPWDVLLDSIGAAAMMGCVYLYLRLFRRARLTPEVAAAAVQ